MTKGAEETGEVGQGAGKCLHLIWTSNTNNTISEFRQIWTLTKVKWQEEVQEEVVEETNAGASRFQSAHGLCNEDTNPSEPARTNGEF